MTAPREHDDATEQPGRFVYRWPKADITVDCVVFGLEEQEDGPRVLLVRRGKPDEPFHGRWALPGGFIEMDESLEESARRELESETGVSLSYLEQLYTFGTPGRDPRGRVVTIAYLALVRPNDVELAAADDADDARWFAVDALPELAFDHDAIIELARRRLRSKLRWQPVGFGLLPERFTLSELQRVYEVILGHELDKRNFRRKVLGFEVLVDTGEWQREVGRPAKLYHFDERKYRTLLERGVDFEV
ncbi:MAG: NUDIX domain-containing protein [Acidobacteriota bacterium]